MDCRGARRDGIRHRHRLWHLRTVEQQRRRRALHRWSMHQRRERRLVRRSTKPGARGGRRLRDRARRGRDRRWPLHRVAALGRAAKLICKTRVPGARSGDLVTGPRPRVAQCVLLSLCLLDCELVVGGPEQAIVRPRDGEAEGSGHLEAGIEAALLPDAGSHEADAPDPPGPPPPPPRDAGGPCVPAPTCLPAEQACLKKCSTQDDECMAWPPYHDNKCQVAFDDCETTCESTCASCVSCPMDTSACGLPR